MRMADVAIVGGGVIGCACAYALAKEGVSVLVLERDRVGAHASGGAAGLLSSRDDEPGDPMDRLNRPSLALHGPTAEELREATRIDVEFQQAGSLTLLAAEEMPAAVRSDARLLDKQELHELEPQIGGPWAGAILHLGDGQVNTGRLTQALAEGAVRLGASIEEGSVVTGLLRRGERVRGVRTVRDEVEAEHVVLAAGPWSGLLEETVASPVPVFPVKGEIVWVKSRPVALQRPVFAGCYLVPKPEMGLALGATHVTAGFDETPTMGGAFEMMRLALAAVPSLAGAAFSHVWASVRPATPDGLPLLGPVEGSPGLIMATGHYAYGIALSLITAELVRNWVLDRPQPLDTQAFRLERFAARPAAR